MIHSDGKFNWLTKQRVVGLLFVLALAFMVRGLTANFISARLDDAGWFQYGSYKVFDTRAQNILDGSEHSFLIEDPTRTDLMQYPPAFPMSIAAIYALTGDRSSHAVHRVIWVLDAFAVLLIVGIGVTAFGWKVGIAGGVLAAISPLLATTGVSPSSDPPTTWFVLASLWLLVAAARRASWRFALASGVVLGIACWFRVNPLFLAFFWAPALMLAVREAWRVRLILSAAIIGGTILVVAPIAIRNVVVFREIALTGLNAGTNLWEGLGETEYGRSLGAPYGDEVMTEMERVEMGRPGDKSITPAWPDGIRRDRERARKSLAIIADNPVWYAGVMAGRMWGMLNLAGEPSPYYGSTGINCTPSKCLSEEWHGGVVALGVKVLGMIQSVSRYLALPLMIIGLIAAFNSNWRTSLLLFSTVFYYLVPGTFAHTELRYVLPMHAVLLVFAGLGVVWITEKIRRKQAVL